MMGKSMHVVKCFIAPHRSVDVPLDEDVEDRQCEVGHKLPDLPCQQHPQDPVRSTNPYPAPAHRHF